MGEKMVSAVGSGAFALMSKYRVEENVDAHAPVVYVRESPVAASGLDAFVSAPEDASRRSNAVVVLVPGKMRLVVNVLAPTCFAVAKVADVRPNEIPRVNPTARSIAPARIERAGRVRPAWGPRPRQSLIPRTTTQKESRGPRLTAHPGACVRPATERSRSRPAGR